MASLADIGVLRDPEPDVVRLPDPTDVDVSDQDASTIVVDSATGAIITANDDGTVDVDTDPQPDQKSGTSVKAHDANLAEYVGDGNLKTLAEMLLEAIDSDNTNRSTWVSTRTRGMELLGLQLEPPRGDAGSSAAPLEGMSSVRHPLLLEACIRFQSNARGELLPADGPVKVRNDGGKTAQADDLAEDLEDDFNHYLTVDAPEYYPDTDRALFETGFSGCSFKKVYNCPLRRRPVSESVDGADLIVPATATDLKTAPRITHRIMMQKSTLKRMQIVGAYRDIALSSQPTEDPTPVDQKKAQIDGQNISTIRPEDARYTIYECYTEVDPKDLGVDEANAPDGLPLPYKITVNKDDRQVLEIRRNWEEDDKEFHAKSYFVKYPFVRAFGFYDIGLVNILGNATQALTAAWRIALDSGMFANFPGFIYSKAASRQVTNEFRIPPGGGLPIDTGGLPLNQAVMPLPYKDVSSGMMAMIEHVEEVGQRLGGTADIQIGEGRQDAPVGTTIALIEQATKIVDAVHKRIHAAQAEEFQLLKERFQEDPEAFWRHNKSPSRQWDAEKFLAALSQYDLIPVADPNSSSHMQRIMKAQALYQLAQANPTKFDQDAVYKRIFKMIGIDDGASLLVPSPPSGAQPPPDLKLAGQVQDNQVKLQTTAMANQAKSQQAELRAHEVAVESLDRAADRESRERIEAAKLGHDQDKTAAQLLAQSADGSNPDTGQ